MALLLVHEYCFVHFLYESRIISKRTVRLGIFEKLPYVFYIVPTTYFFFFMVRENTKVLRRLDAKYTPIWVKITEEQALKKK
jgi:hypothetical protein